MGNYAVTRLDKIHSGKAGIVESVVSATDTLQNGHVIHVGGLATGHREALSVVQPTTASITTQEILLHSSVPLTYLAGQNETDFALQPGQVGRAYHLNPGDIVTVANSVLTGVTGTSADTGKYLIPQNASYQLAVATDLTGGTRFAAQIIGQDTLVQGTVPATVFRVIKA